MSAEKLTWLEQECRSRLSSGNLTNQQRLVFGDGLSEKPSLMLIGEAPGEQESLQGKPFVGKAGKNLTEFLHAVGLNREDLYISNVVKYRPTRQSEAGRIVNRPPSQEEINLFIPWLCREIAIVKPHALVTLGNVALRALAGNQQTIGECHGQWRQVTITPVSEPALVLPLFALYHPASVIYNRSLGEVYREDLAKLRKTLEEHDGQIDT